MKALRLSAAILGILTMIVIDACGSNEGVVSSSDSSSQGISNSQNGTTDDGQAIDDGNLTRFDTPDNSGGGN